MAKTKFRGHLAYFINICYWDLSHSYLSHLYHSNAWLKCPISLTQFSVIISLARKWQMESKDKSFASIVFRGLQYSIENDQNSILY